MDNFDLKKYLSEGKLLKESVSKDLENRNQPLYDELVAGSGESDTMEGEMLRAINRIVYRYYNDGDEYHTGYGIETVGPAHSFLVNANTEVKSAMNMIFKNGTNYEKTIEDALEHILSHIEAKQGKYTKNTAGDMFDYDAEFEDDTYEEDDYDDFEDDDAYLNENSERINTDKEFKINLKDLTFDQITKIFTDNYKDIQFTRIQPNGEEGNFYKDYINFPKSDDSSVGIGDEKAWKSWKSKIMGEYGNVTIILKPKSKNWFDKISIDDDKFNQARNNFRMGKQSFIDREDALGRSTD